MPNKHSRANGRPAIKVRDMEAKKAPKGGQKSGRHHRPISIVKTTDQSTPVLLGP